MIEQLFGSKTRVKLLGLFMSNPNRSFYVREITRKVDEQINSVRRELANLLSIGVITSDDQSNRLYYEVNQNFTYYEPLAQMFGGKVVKKAKKVATEEQPTIVSEIQSLGNVSYAVMTGQFTRDERSGVDLVIVGDVNKTKLENFVNDLEAAEKKEIRYVVFSKKDFEYRKQINDRFVLTLLSSKLQVLVDKE